jgi:hypothetical protein
MILSDIATETRLLVDATPTSYLDADVLRRVNNAYEDLVGDIITADGTWEMDDSRYTNLPYGVTDLVEGQSQYTFDGSMLEIENVKVLQTSGYWMMLKPWDQTLTDMPLENYLKVNSMPVWYDKEGNTLTLLYPPSASVVTLSGGLKVQFKRTASLFTSAEWTAGTASPGFASPYHMLLCLKAALPYAMSYKKDRVALIQGEIQRLHAALIMHYGTRARDERKVISSRGINFR